jgi:hypothetical protein
MFLFFYTFVYNIMAEKKPNASQTQQKNSTLGFVEISEIRDSVMILRENQMRAVLGVSSANFALKSIQEQEIIIGSFQGVLNSIEYPIQILVQSRRLDLSSYIEKLKQLEDNHTNDLLRIKMQEYVEYIKQMLQEVNIMNKDFYVVVGYEPVTLRDGLFGRFLRALNPTRLIKQKQEDFLRNRKLLMSRSDAVASRLASLDLKVNLLNTEQLIALAYNSYNPDLLESIRLRDVSAIDIEG